MSQLTYFYEHTFQFSLYFTNSYQLPLNGHFKECMLKIQETCCLKDLCRAILRLSLRK